MDITLQKKSLQLVNIQKSRDSSIATADKCLSMLNPSTVIIKGKSGKDIPKLNPVVLKNAQIMLKELLSSTVHI